MEIGNVFLLSYDVKHINDHAFIVISLPQKDPENIVMVSITTLEVFKDQSCVLDVGDHSWIKHRSCISYIDGTVATEEELDMFLAKGMLQMLEPAGDPLLDKVLEGAEITEDLPGKCKRVLANQGLISG